MSRPARRLIVDVSSIARWVGPAVGIVRAERELAIFAQAHRTDAMLSFYDPRSRQFRTLQPRWQETVLGWHGAIEAGAFATRVRARTWLPTRGPMMQALERWRLTASVRTGKLAAHHLQRLLLAGRRHRYPFAAADGQRLALVPPDLALGPAIEPMPGDILVCAGADWLHKDVTVLAELRARHGVSIAVLCFDLIPLLFPNFFKPQDREPFRRHWERMLPIADLVMVTAERIAADVRELCATAGIAPPARIAVVPLGYEAAPAKALPPLPEGLEPDRFVVFVSTIEPRKGHAMLLRAWGRLLADGVIQRAGFRLAIVGRPGWMVDETLAALADPARFAGTVLHLANANDATVTSLYRHAAFSVYPSVYEGFGLPIIEAFAHGCPVIGSTGGSIPETMAGLGPCLDPLDEEAWATALRDWIEQPDLRQQHRDRVVQHFAHPLWPDAAARIFAAIDEMAAQQHPLCVQPGARAQPAMPQRQP